MSVRMVVRPWWGFLTLQPIILLWFWLFSDDWWADYQSLGWPLQIICTIYLIPMYELYERFWNGLETDAVK